MNLKALKAKLADLKPFVVYNFLGVGNCLAETDDDGKLVLKNDKPTPLSVSVEPPSLTFIVESEQITSLILRFSDTYEELSKKKPDNLDAKTALAKELVENMQKRVLKSPEGRLQQVATMTRLGKEFIIVKAIDCWYGDYDTAEKSRIQFTHTQEEAIKGNAESDDSILFVWIENLTEMDFINISMALISAVPTDEIPIPNIPIAETLIDEDGKIEKGVVTESVPADKVASFPVNIRNIAVEDAPTRSGESVGNSGGNP